MSEDVVDVFVALDGPVLNGMEGPVGVMRLRYEPSTDSHDLKIQFFEGATGGHAVQINKEGTIGHVGGFSRTLIFFDTQTLQEIKRFSTTNFAPTRWGYESQTHVVFVQEREFVTSIGGSFWKCHIDYVDQMDRWENLGPHKSFLPHAMKLSPSGRYIMYGVMDTDDDGFARQFGVFDLQETDPEKRARILNIDETAWHFAFHPTEDIAYAVSECYDPGHGIAGKKADFYCSFSIGYRRNWVWKIDAKTCREIDKMSMPAFYPSHLTSDVVVIGDEDDTVFYNACASSTVCKVSFKKKEIDYIDEGVGFWYTLFHPSLWGAAIENLREAQRRVSIFGNIHLLFRALETSRGSLLDGSYGLVLSPCKKVMFSCHRGLNQIIIYNYPDMSVRKRIKLPSAKKFFPGRFGMFTDRRLGMHHAYRSIESARR